MSNNSTNEEKRGDTRPRETYDPKHRGDPSPVSLKIPLEYRMTVNFLAERRGVDAKDLFAEIIMKGVDEMYPPPKRAIYFNKMWEQEQEIQKLIKRDMASLAV